ncbi:MAG: hypothetical protein K2K82_03030 [Muribaculaceae bacterium]|nr:hypothetical protein [Muribaculaceae bacterium]
MLRFSFLIVLACWSSAAFSQDGVDAKSPAPQDSVEIQQIAAPPQAQIDSLNNVISTLESLNRKSAIEIEHKNDEIKNLKGEITNLKETTIKQLNERNDSILRKLINVASNFLYIPFEDYSVNKIAIPAFKMAQGTPFYVKYQNRLALLENYKDDIVAIIGVLNVEPERMKVPNLGFLKIKGAERKEMLEALPCYQRYKAYDDWENTYLGNYIAVMLKNYNNPSVTDTYSTLESIKSNLQTLLNNNQ